MGAYHEDVDDRAVDAGHRDFFWYHTGNLDQDASLTYPAAVDAVPTNLLSTSEAADLLNMSVRKVQRWARDGKIPYVRQLPGPTGAYLFDRTALTPHKTGG